MQNEEGAKGAGVGGDTVRRYIRLTELQPALLSMVDEGGKSGTWNLIIPVDKIEKYFSRSYTPKRMEKVVFEFDR